MQKCVPVDQPQSTRTQAVLSELAPDLEISTQHPALTNIGCCLFHCEQCCTSSSPDLVLNATSVVLCTS